MKPAIGVDGDCVARVLFEVAWPMDRFQERQKAFEHKISEVLEIMNSKGKHT
jgi:hypothetical protein